MVVCVHSEAEVHVQVQMQFSFALIKTPNNFLLIWNRARTDKKQILDLNSFLLRWHGHCGFVVCMLFFFFVVFHIYVCTAACSYFVYSL